MLRGMDFDSDSSDSSFSSSSSSSMMMGVVVVVIHEEEEKAISIGSVSQLTPSMECSRI